MTEKEILLAFLGKTLNLPTESVAPLLYKKGDDEQLTDQLNDTALSDLLRADQERVAKLKPNTEEFFNNGYKKAQAEVATSWERKLREKFGVDPEGKLQGDALTDAIKLAAAAPANPDEVKKTAAYLEMERTLQQQIAQAKAEAEAEVAKVTQAFQKKETWQQVSSRIKANLLELNPILPEDKAKADRVMDLFLRDFQEYEFQQDGEDFVPVKDGKRVENSHGHPRRLTELVQERAQWLFDFNKQAPAGNGGNSNGGGRTVNVKFTSENDFIDQYTKATPEQQQVLAAAWEAQSKQG